MTTFVKRGLLAVLTVLFVTIQARAQAPVEAIVERTSPVGRWVTIDDERNEPRSIVEIYEKNGLLYARVDSIYFREGEPHDPVCEKCEGDKKDQPILGMQIMWDMKPDKDQWSGGRILDPEKGKTYRCKIWVEDGTLKVRGYVAFLHRTQTWLPAK